MYEYLGEEVGEEVGEGVEYTANQVVEEAVLQMEMGLTYHISLVTLKMQSGTHYQTKQEKG